MQSLLGDSGGSSEDQNAGENANNKDCVHEISDGNKDSICNWTSGHSCYIVEKNLSIFLLCPKIL
jgi:hypothetical protein